MTDRCATCTGRFHVINGDGPERCRVAMFGQNPGKQEEASAERGEFGRVFIGDAGRELNEHYLALAGLVRSDDVFMSNVMKCVYGPSLVVMRDGSTRRIEDLVNNRVRGTVRAIDERGNVSKARITDWFRSPLGDRELYSIRYENFRARGRRGVSGTVVTGDHELLVIGDNGALAWKRTDECNGKQVCTGHPGLTNGQISLLVGMALGDAHLGDAYFSCDHGPKQKEYAAFKSQLFAEIGLIDDAKPAGFTSKRSPALRKFIESWRKDPFSLIDSHFSSDSLAVWAMDDGSLARDLRGGNGRPRFEICAKSKSEELLKHICKKINDLSIFDCYLNKGRIYFNVDNVPHLMREFGHAFPACLRYKLTEDAPPFRKNFFKQYNCGVSLFDTAVIERSSKKTKTVYCLGTTRGNFMTPGGIVHNCHTENDRKPSPREIATCAAHHMPGELIERDPELIVLMGSPACSIVPEIWLEAHHGYPMKVDLFGVNRWVVPFYHPAAGLHDTQMMTELMQDFERLRKIVGGDYSVPVDEYPNPDYRDLTGNHAAIEAILRQGLNSERILARDTEYLQLKKSPIKKPWCSTFTIDPGTGYMIRATDREGLQVLARYMPYYYGILHNALADLDVEKALGLPEALFDDTMQLAAHQQDLPQKLKALAWRLAGMTMKDYEDVVMPYSRVAVMEWLEQAFDIAVLTPGTKYTKGKRKVPSRGSVESQFKALTKLRKELEGVEYEQVGEYFVYKIAEECDSDLTKKILHIHKHTAKPVPADADKPYNPWEAWREQVVEKLGPEIENEVVKRIGPMPQASIQEVFVRNPSEAITYACRDSDSTRRIWPVLKERSHKYDGRVMLGDIDR